MLEQWWIYEKCCTRRCSDFFHTVSRWVRRCGNPIFFSFSGNAWCTNISIRIIYLWACGLFIPSLCIVLYIRTIGLDTQFIFFFFLTIPNKYIIIWLLFRPLRNITLGIINVYSYQNQNLLRCARKAFFFLIKRDDYPERPAFRYDFISVYHYRMNAISRFFSFFSNLYDNFFYDLVTILRFFQKWIHLIEIITHLKEA